MTTTRLIFKEMLHRWGAFALGVACVAAAVGSLVGALALLRAHDLRTEQIIAAKQTKVQQDMTKLKDDYRKITKRMGFNVLILPKDQNLADLYADDYAIKHMPESYVRKLANARIFSVRHLLPTLRQKLEWPEQRRTIILIGVRGEVPFLHRAPKKPMLEAVARGNMTVGYELHSSLNMSVGDRLKLRGRDFTVSQLQPPRGNKDDITIWINLEEAQELLDKKGLINGILALECHCAWADVGKVRHDISAVLPDTQVIEFAGKALGRAEARRRAAEHAQASIRMEKKNRSRLRAEREDFAAVLVPVVIVACGLWVAYLSLSNVRERRVEIGILRALGFTSAHIRWVFLIRAKLMGLLGAVLGVFIGLVVGATLAEQGASGLMMLFSPFLSVILLLVTPALSALAAFVPALLAARQDPAAVLREG